MLAPKPPVVKTTALAEIVFSLPSIVTLTPVTLPSFRFFSYVCILRIKEFHVPKRYVIIRSLSIPPAEPSADGEYVFRS